MRCKSTYKIPNGKLLKISLNYNEKTNKIIDLKIMGDFFAYPEESIEIIENNLKNTILENDVLYKKIESIVNKNMIQFIGIDTKGILKGIMMCKK
jgi:hypothetical protein